MSNDIFGRIVNEKLDLRARLAGAQAAREWLYNGVFGFDRGWYHRRVCLLHSMDGAVTLKGPPRLVFGFQDRDDPGAGYGDGAGTLKFVGVRSKNSKWDYDPAGFYSCGNLEMTWKHGEAFGTTDFATPIPFYISANPAIRNGFLIDFFKEGFFSYIRICHPVTPEAAMRNMTEEELLEMVDITDVFNFETLQDDRPTGIPDGYEITSFRTGDLIEHPLFGDSFLFSWCMYWNQSAAVYENSCMRGYFE
jgi:hypothetical protein